METSKDRFAATRLAMVRDQIQARGVRNKRLLEAMTDVPREKFLPESRRHHAYEDAPQPIGHEQTISQPYVVALMCDALNPGPEDRVLDVGSGSGYQTAVLAHMSQWVYGIERHRDLADRARAVLARIGVGNVSIRCGDGTLGWPEEAPFERIICGAAAPHIPEAWREQLADPGRIVAPVGDAAVQSVLVLDKQDGRIQQTNLGDVRFVRLIGEDGWQTQ